MPTNTISGRVSDDLRSVFIQSVERGVPDQALASRLRRCTDIIPRRVCEALGLAQGASFVRSLGSSLIPGPDIEHNAAARPAKARFLFLLN